MRKVFTAVIAVLVLGGCAIHSYYKPGQQEYKFRFAKRFLFNTYHLKIINKSKRRSIGFYFYNGANYYVLLNNGQKVPFDSRVFYDLSAKGAYWVDAGKSGVIPFEISEFVMRRAKRIVFKGQTYVPRRQAGFLRRDDIRNIILIADIADRKITISEGVTMQALPTVEIENYYSLGETPPDKSRFYMKQKRTRQEKIEEILEKY